MWWGGVANKHYSFLFFSFLFTFFFSLSGIGIPSLVCDPKTWVGSWCFAWSLKTGFSKVPCWVNNCLELECKRHLNHSLGYNLCSHLTSGMPADTLRLQVIFLLLHHAEQTRELTAPSNPRQVWDLVLVPVTSHTAQNAGGQPKQKLHFWPSTWENLLQGEELQGWGVVGLQVCEHAAFGIKWRQVLSCMWIWLNTELEATNATDADTSVCWRECCSYGLKQGIPDFEYWHCRNRTLFSPSVPYFPNTAVVWVKHWFPCFKHGAVLREPGDQSAYGDLGVSAGDHPRPWCEVGAPRWGR